MTFIIPWKITFHWTWQKGKFKILYRPATIKVIYSYQGNKLKTETLIVKEQIEADIMIIENTGPLLNTLCRHFKTLRPPKQGQHIGQYLIDLFSNTQSFYSCLLGWQSIDSWSWSIVGRLPFCMTPYPIHVVWIGAIMTFLFCPQRTDNFHTRLMIACNRTLRNKRIKQPSLTLKHFESLILTK